MSLRRFMHRTRKDEDLAEEIESHLAHEQDKNGARGLPADEARPLWQVAQTQAAAVLESALT